MLKTDSRVTFSKEEYTVALFALEIKFQKVSEIFHDSETFLGKNIRTY